MHPTLRRILGFAPPPPPTDTVRTFTREELAIPLTQDQAGHLVTALHLTDQLAERPIVGSISYARRQAEEVAARAGAAVAGDRSYVPIPVLELPLYTGALTTLAVYIPGSPELLAFETLVTQMHTLRGMAAVQHWRVTALRGVLVWVEDPTLPVQFRPPTTTDREVTY